MSICHAISQRAVGSVLDHSISCPIYYVHNSQMDKKKSCAQRTQNKLKIDKIVRMYSSNFNISFHYSSFVSLFHCNYIHLIHFLIMYESKKMHPFYNFPSSSTIFLFQLLHDPTRFSCGSEANTVRLLIEDGKCTIFTI